jgi:deoxyribodipyrimidine photo-lyase
MEKPRVNIVWLRRDLRIDDNAAFYYALKEGLPVVPFFLFDRNILDKLENKHDKRVTFIHDVIKGISDSLKNYKAAIEVIYGFPKEAFEQLLSRYQVEKVFANHDYEKYGRERDVEMAGFLFEKGVKLLTAKDQVIFDKNEVVKDDGSPYTVFTPYSKRWRAKLNDFYLKPYPVLKYVSNLLKQEQRPIPSLGDMGFEETDHRFPSAEPNESLIQSYDRTRDFPAVEGTSRMGIHLRFGTVSVRQLVKEAMSLNSTYLNELIWREFYQMITWHFPHVGEGKAFRPEYDNIQWRNNETEFERWCKGETGYPIVDAGMRQLNETGFMHNRVRMITASFLSKHLLIDWRWGEAYFAEKLLDYDFAPNNGGWQWAAGSGCDAAPYFRIFNPYLQTKRFDPHGKYIRQWVPEFESLQYPKPIVVHEFARQRCLETYKAALRKS